MALNAETENDDGSEHRNWEEIVALKAELEGMVSLNAGTGKRWWLWTPKLGMMMALNAEIENDYGFELQNEEWW